jgi:hypothetical protein
VGHCLYSHAYVQKESDQLSNQDHLAWTGRTACFNCLQELSAQMECKNIKFTIIKGISDERSSPWLTMRTRSMAALLTNALLGTQVQTQEHVPASTVNLESLPG